MLFLGGREGVDLLTVRTVTRRLPAPRKTSPEGGSGPARKGGRVLWWQDEEEKQESTRKEEDEEEEKKPRNGYFTRRK